MRHKPSIRFEIPVPWAAKAACIEAKGIHAVIVAGIVAAILFACIAFG